MARVHFAEKAVQDLTNIWNYTFDTWSERQADKYFESLVDLCNRLGDEPGLGKRYPEIANDILGYKVGQHIIFYQKNTDKEIHIIRILHSRMDLKNRLDE